MQIVSGTAWLDIQPKLTDFDALQSTGEGIAAIITPCGTFFVGTRGRIDFTVRGRKLKIESRFSDRA